MSGCLVNLAGAAGADFTLSKGNRRYGNVGREPNKRKEKDSDGLFRGSPTGSTQYAPGKRSGMDAGPAVERQLERESERGG